MHDRLPLGYYPSWQIRLPPKMGIAYGVFLSVVFGKNTWQNNANCKIFETVLFHIIPFHPKLYSSILFLSIQNLMQDICQRLHGVHRLFQRIGLGPYLHQKALGTVVKVIAVALQVSPAGKAWIVFLRCQFHLEGKRQVIGQIGIGKVCNLPIGRSPAQAVENIICEVCFPLTSDTRWVVSATPSLCRSMTTSMLGFSARICSSAGPA